MNTRGEPPDEVLTTIGGALADAIANRIAERLAECTRGGAQPLRPSETAPASWRERLWIAPAETRIGKAELLEALGKPESWLYRHTSAAASQGGGNRAKTRRAPVPRIPHRKLDGELIFVVGEVRAWIREHEDIVEAGPMESSAGDRRGWGVVDGGRAS